MATCAADDNNILGEGNKIISIVDKLHTGIIDNCDTSI